NELRRNTLPQLEPPQRLAAVFLRDEYERARIGQPGDIRRPAVPPRGELSRRTRSTVVQIEPRLIVEGAPHVGGEIREPLAVRRIARLAVAAPGTEGQ